MNSSSDDAGDTHKRGDERDIYSSESKRSFKSEETPQTSPVAEREKPKRYVAADETKPAADETTPPPDVAESAPKKKATESTPSDKKPEGDEPPPSLDKSVDEGPL